MVIIGVVFRPVRVSGPSMMPQLSAGQLIAVAPTWLAPVGRHQVVVFREPDTGTVAVKRVVGLPGERIQLISGDLFIDGSRYHRDVSGPRELVPLVDAVGDEIKDYFGFNSAPAIAMLVNVPYDGFLSNGELHSGEMPASDISICADFRLEQSGQIELVVREGEHLFHASFDGLRAELKLGEVAWPPTVVNLPVEAGQLMLAKLDQQIFLLLNGERILGPFSYPPAKTSTLADVPVGPAFEQAGIGGEGVFFDRVRVGRDLFRAHGGTWACVKELQLTENEYFLLGDNHQSSRDSRHYGPVSSDLLMGNAGVCWPQAGAR